VLDQKIALVPRIVSLNIAGLVHQQLAMAWKDIEWEFRCSRIDLRTRSSFLPICLSGTVKEFQVGKIALFRSFSILANTAKLVRCSETKKPVMY
jgi:hypothetical protein